MNHPVEKNDGLRRLAKTWHRRKHTRAVHTKRRERARKAVPHERYRGSHIRNERIRTHFVAEDRVSADVPVQRQPVHALDLGKKETQD